MTKLITGATGQIGSELIPALAALYGSENIIALGHKRKPSSDLGACSYFSLDIRDQSGLQNLVETHQVDTFITWPHYYRLWLKVIHSRPGILI